MLLIVPPILNSEDRMGRLTQKRWNAIVARLDSDRFLFFSCADPILDLELIAKRRIKGDEQPVPVRCFHVFDLHLLVFVAGPRPETSCSASAFKG